VCAALYVALAEPFEVTLFAAYGGKPNWNPTTSGGQPSATRRSSGRAGLVEHPAAATGTRDAISVAIPSTA